jgi:hypothetical protein
MNRRRIACNVMGWSLGAIVTSLSLLVFVGIGGVLRHFGLVVVWTPPFWVVCLFAFYLFGIAWIWSWFVLGRLFALRCRRYWGVEK